MCEARATGSEPIGFCSLHMPRSPRARVPADLRDSSPRAAAQAEPFLHRNRQSALAVIDRLHTHCSA